jgi:hypothetical protein
MGRTHALVPARQQRRRSIFFFFFMFLAVPFFLLYRLPFFIPSFNQEDEI